MKTDKYLPYEIEGKWQEKWQKSNLYQAIDFDKRHKYYILVEFPYPSGAGLHVGHVRSWSAMDTYARKKRMENFNVLYPIGWDAFGLPAENYAIKMGVHPSQIVPQNIARFKTQCKSLGLSFDWTREINTSDPKYYKWTQWIFLKMYEKGLAYQADVPVNWCPTCKTNLADEEVLSDGKHERCGCPTVRRMQKQWLLKITKYAQRLIDDLQKVDYSTKIKVQQENWIGKSKGAEIDFKLADLDNKITVFTTRPDTLFGVTAIIIAPEHPLVSQLIQSEQKDHIEEYIKKAQRKSELDRTALEKEKTGVFTGSYAINPLSQEKIPVWIGDYVIGWYGKGAVMFVPAHDSRDYDLAVKYNLPIKVVISPSDSNSEFRVQDSELQFRIQNEWKAGAYEEEGILENSGEFNGLSSREAKKAIIGCLEKHNKGKETVQFKLRDWVFSRQHYWGEPIPVVYCTNCAKEKLKYQISNINGVEHAIVPVPEEDLPVELPYLEKYQPIGTGESPLAAAEDWMNVQCPVCKGPGKRETDTMPNWAGSNWYYLRYLDPQNDEKLVSADKMAYWMPVDLYQGGFEHTTLHLLYSRFVYKFLYDIKVVSTPEPYLKRRSHGIVLGTDGRKMSKSFGNVINPEVIVGKFGADTLRVYEMFMGPFEQTIAWSEEGVEGCFRFLKRVWQLSLTRVSKAPTNQKLLRQLHKTIKKVGEDLETMKFNTCIASLMEFINVWQADEEGLSKEDLAIFLLITAPITPHITEEIWQMYFGKGEFMSIHQQKWPEYNPGLIRDDEVTLVVQVNGKLRDTLNLPVPVAMDQEEVEKRALESTNVNKHINGKKIVKYIFVPEKLINIVTTS